MILSVVQFSGNCAQAIEFYQNVFSAKVISIEYNRDAPADTDISKNNNADTEDRVMHAEIEIMGTLFHMCDIMEEVIPGNMFLYSVFFHTSAEVTNAYSQLVQGGQIIVEIGPQFFSPWYGSVEDRFGVRWQLITLG